MNKQTITVGIIVGALLVSPFLASALTIEDLQVQLKALLSKVLQLQTTQSSNTVYSQTGVGSSSVISVTAVPRICAYDYAGSLGYGNRGDGVVALQEFLRSEGVFSAGATGFFGIQTQSALQSWQASQGIVSSGSARTTGWGVLGPLTRDKVAARCGTANTISVYPSSGPVPLTVKVTSQVGDASSYQPSFADGQDTLIDFGDGSARQWVQCQGNMNDRYGTMCATPQTFAHTYTQSGTYTIALLKAGGMCVGGCPERILGSVYVTAGDFVSQKFDAQPRSGDAPLSVEFTFMPAGDDSVQYYIEYGDGQGQIMNRQQIYCIRAPCISSSKAAHTYSAAGDYTATVSRYFSCLYSEPRCMMAQPAPLSSVVIHVTGNTSSNKPPTISSLSGPTTLALNQSGTWSVTASDPENGQLTYNIWWGDENVYASNMSSAGAARDFTQTTTFTHAYANAGEYAVTITVRDSYGQEARTSATVRVGNSGVACMAQYEPVCGRPQGCMNTCAPGMYCTMMCRLHDPQTYSNRCQLDAAGAEYLYYGTCTGNTQ